MAKTCAKAGACGGCCFSGTKYSLQLEKKQAYIEKLLGRYCKVAPIYGMEDPFYYRNKVQSVFGCDRNGKLISGIYRYGTHHLIEVHSCMIENRIADEVLMSVRDLARRFGLSAYDEDRGTGFLRHVLVKIAVATGQVMVVLVTSTYDFKQSRSFVSQLVERHPQIKTVLINKNDEKTSMVLSGEPVKILYGDGYITDELCGLSFRISARSFYQVNPVQAARMYTCAMRMARLTGNEKVIDAYCGTGTIGLIASSFGAGEVVGIELNGDAVSDANENARLNGITNATFICDDASSCLKEMAKNGESADVVFMDPPRAGSDERFLSSVIKLSPKTIVYISCNPDTLERDLRYLTKMSSYRVIGIQPVDLFPQTEHVETVVLLSKKNVEPKHTISIGVDADEYYRIKNGK